MTRIQQTEVTTHLPTVCRRSSSRRGVSLLEVSVASMVAAMITVSASTVATDELRLCFDSSDEATADWMAPDLVVTYSLDEDRLVRSENLSGRSFVVARYVEGFTVASAVQMRELSSAIRIEQARIRQGEISSGPRTVLAMAVERLHTGSAAADGTSVAFHFNHVVDGVATLYRITYVRKDTTWSVSVDPDPLATGLPVLPAQF